MKSVGLMMAAALIAAAPRPADQCTVARSSRFNEGGEEVRSARGKPDSGNFTVFRAPLAVNTDGAPTSYHPDDFLGSSLAINRIDNGIKIRRSDGGKLSVTEQRAVFDRWRRESWIVPSGYRITWQNVIAARDGKPCVFAAGPEKGYFGSLTSLKQEVPAADAGECGRLDQVDLRHIPAIALRGTISNPLWVYGARKGDLVLAINPSTGTRVAAIIADTGDANRIGEGSVALNMQLLGRTAQPKTYTDAVKLDTGRRNMVVAVLDGSKNWKRSVPYTSENLDSRVSTWASAHGYGSIEGLATQVLNCADGL